MTAAPSSRATAAVRRDLGRLVGSERVITEPAALFGYSYDSTTVLRGTPPLAVVQPADTRHVAALLTYANTHDLPIIPRGSGTGLSGGCVPLAHELVLDLSRINRLRAVEATRRRAIAEPGVLTGDLLAAATPAGLFYPPDPSSFKVSSLGGNVAENAGGPRGLKYGVTQDYVQALEVVLLDGEVHALRRDEDWDVLALFIGSEGTLGAITLVEVRLIPTPPARRALLAVFPRLADATRTVSVILREGITPALIELMDDIAIRCVEAYRGLGLPLDVEAILLIETDGDEHAADRDAARVRDLCTTAGAAARCAWPPRQTRRRRSGRRGAQLRAPSAGCGRTRSARTSVCRVRRSRRWRGGSRRSGRNTVCRWCCSVTLATATSIPTCCSAASMPTSGAGVKPLRTPSSRPRPSLAA